MQGLPPGQPYPGFADVHADYYQRQQQAASAPQAGSANPLHNLHNWGMPQARPGLNAQEQAYYDGARRKLRAKILQFVGLLTVLAIIGVVAIVRALT